MKISLVDVNSGYQTATQQNANNATVEDHLNNKVLYRDNPTGEPNAMQNELDMNSNSITNADTVAAQSVQVNGVAIVPGDTLTIDTAATVPFVPAGDVAAVNVQAAIEEVDTEKPSFTRLASVALGDGASLIGIYDLAGNFSGSSVEQALAELVTLIDAGDAITMHDYVSTTIHVNNSTTLVDALQLALDGGAYYAVDGFLRLDQSATGADIKLLTQGQAGWDGCMQFSLIDDTYSEIVQDINTTPNTTLSFTMQTKDNTIRQSIRFSGFVETVGSGNLTLQYAQAVAAVGNTSIRAGSWIRVRKLN